MNENERDIWTAVKGLFQVIQSQQRQIEALSQSHGRLSDLLLKAVSGDADASPHAPSDTETVRKTRAEIEMLERLFQAGDDAPTNL